jgi:hypothetical protein
MVAMVIYKVNMNGIANGMSNRLWKRRTGQQQSDGACEVISPLDMKEGRNLLFSTQRTLDCK